MWALPGLTTNDIADIDAQMNMGGLWGVLLFRKADRNILKGLEQNWSAFNEALGRNAHVVTLLDMTMKEDAVSLKFPKNYESAVGKFCNELLVGLDELPALVLLNGRSQQFEGVPYWSLQRANLKESSDALVRLVGDLQRATHKPQPSTEALKTDWLQQATERLLDSAAGREMRGVILKNQGAVVSILRTLIGRVHF